MVLSDGSHNETRLLMNRPQLLSHGLRRLRPVQVRSGTRGIVTAADVDKARKYCQRQLQHSDYDAHLIQRTLPTHVRDAYLALRTLNLELVRLPEVVTNPTIGAMRMQFWRESIDKTFAGNPPAEPTCVLLHEAVTSLQSRGGGSSRAAATQMKFWIQRVIRTRERHMDNRPFATLASLEEYAENTYATLMYATLAALPVQSVHADHLASHIGKAAGIVAVLRGVPVLSSIQSYTLQQIVREGPAHPGSQRENLWGDILGSKTSLEPNTDAGRDATDRIEVADSMADLAARKPQAPPGIFTGCTALTAGFESWKAKVLSETIASLGGTICNTLQQLLDARGPSAFQRFLVVPQSSQPETHPQLPSDAYIDIVTEFFVERCLHNKTLCQPSDHVLGRPFARFPVDGFEDLAICTAGFTGIDLLHVEKCTTQMGAKYASRLNEATSVLVCRSVMETRPEKLRFARDSMIPVVSADWLWACVESGFNVPVKEFLCTGLGQSEALTPRVRTIQDNKRAGLQRRLSASAPPRSSDSSTRQPSRGALVDGDAFAQEPSARGAGTTRGTEGSTHFQTARTHQKDSFGSGAVPAPLADLSSNALNRSPSPPKTAPPPAKTANTTGDGFSKSVDLPPPDENDPAPTAQPVLPETVAIQAEDEEEQEGKQEADAHDTSATTDVVAQKRVREAETAAERAAISSHIASLVNTRSHASEEPTGPEGGDDRPPARRRRGIFGRATSNVSAASSASHESGRPGGRQQAHEDAAQPPPATQVRYDDPEAAQCKAELMRRMLGEGGQAVGKKAVRKRAL
ncbi:hypothetical protein BN1723_009886 [Verticillium longisporum]|uniref:BRCT domain-containing protein n=1 Tax=Verticillium longisporum TaxID=100787 RepID=A0A0G4KTH7_VERLO|nr:hypothetical protein BN1723_009886 [Verticillium longisporum]